MIAVAKGNARLDDAVAVANTRPAKLAANRHTPDPPVASGYEKRMPNEWHATAETLAKSKAQNFFSVLYPHRNNDTADDVVILPINAGRGFAASIKSSNADDLVFMAKQGEAKIRTDRVDIDETCRLDQRTKARIFIWH